MISHDAVDDVIIEDARALRDDLNGVENKMAESAHWNQKADAALVEVNQKIAFLMDAKEHAIVSTARSAEIVDSVLNDMKNTLVGTEENLGREIAQIRTRLDKQENQVMPQSSRGGSISLAHENIKATTSAYLS